MYTIREHLKQGTFSKCYLLFGKDDYMIRLYRNKITAAVVSEGDSMNLCIFRDGEASPVEVRDIAETLPVRVNAGYVLYFGAFFCCKKADCI